MHKVNSWICLSQVSAVCTPDTPPFHSTLTVQRKSNHSRRSLIIHEDQMQKMTQSRDLWIAIHKPPKSLFSRRVHISQQRLFQSGDLPHPAQDSLQRLKREWQCHWLSSGLNTAMNIIKSVPKGSLLLLSKFFKKTFTPYIFFPRWDNFWDLPLNNLGRGRK